MFKGTKINPFIRQACEALLYNWCTYLVPLTDSFEFKPSIVSTEFWKPVLGGSGGGSFLCGKLSTLVGGLGGASSSDDFYKIVNITFHICFL